MEKILDFIPREEPYNGEISISLFKKALKGKKLILKDFYFNAKKLPNGRILYTLSGDIIIENKSEVEIKEETDVLEKIYKEILEMKNHFNARFDKLEADVAILKSDMVEVKKRLTRIESCPTIKKELAELDDNNNK